MTYSLQQLPLQERPRERLRRYGAEAISSAELIAIILGSGIKGKSVLTLAQELLARFGSLKALSEASLEELCECRGLGKAKASQLKAAFCLGIKATNHPTPPKYRISHPVHAYQLVKEELETEKQELFIVILQDLKGCVICHEIVAIGTLSEVLVHPREVFYPAIRHKAASLILAHNHPSGDPTPSKEDFHLTQNLIAMGKMMDIPVQDHLIIGQACYTSLRQQGVVF